MTEGSLLIRFTEHQAVTASDMSSSAILSQAVTAHRGERTFQVSPCTAPCRVRGIWPQNGAWSHQGVLLSPRNLGAGLACRVCRSTGPGGPSYLGLSTRSCRKMGDQGHSCMNAELQNKKLDGSCGQKTSQKGPHNLKIFVMKICVWLLRQSQIISQNLKQDLDPRDNAIHMAT